MSEGADSGGGRSLHISSILDRELGAFVLLSPASASASAYVNEQGRKVLGRVEFLQEFAACIEAIETHTKENVHDADTRFEKAIEDDKVFVGIFTEIKFQAPKGRPNQKFLDRWPYIEILKQLLSKLTDAQLEKILTDNGQPLPRESNRQQTRDERVVRFAGPLKKKARSKAKSKATELAETASVPTNTVPSAASGSSSSDKSDKPSPAHAARRKVAFASPSVASGPSAKMPSKGQVVSEDGGADREQERGRTPQKKTATSKSSAGMRAPTAGSSVSGMAPADACEAASAGIRETKIGETEITKPSTSGAQLLSMSGDAVSIRLDLKKPFCATVPLSNPQGKPLLVLEAKPVSSMTVLLKDLSQEERDRVVGRLKNHKTGSSNTYGTANQKAEQIQTICKQSNIYAHLLPEALKVELQKLVERHLPALLPDYFPDQNGKTKAKKKAKADADAAAKGYLLLGELLQLLDSYLAGNRNIPPRITRAMREVVEHCVAADNDLHLRGRFRERYDMGEVIGVGGFGKVFVGFDRVEQKVVAIKVVKKNHQDEGSDHPPRPYTVDQLETHKAEIEMLTGSTHPILIGALDHCTSNDFCAVVLPYIKDGTLEDFMIKKGLCSMEDIKIFLKHVLPGLMHLLQHSELHNDIKPENFLVCYDQDEDDEQEEGDKLRLASVQISDRGAGKRLGSMSKCDTRAGTPRWIAPEVILRLPFDWKADIWSVGFVAVAMAVGLDAARTVYYNKCWDEAEKLPEDSPEREVQRVSDILELLKKTLVERTDDASEFDQVSLEFKEFYDLIQWMLQFDPANRPSPYGALTHKLLEDCNPYEEIAALEPFLFEKHLAKRMEKNTAKTKEKEGQWEAERRQMSTEIQRLRQVEADRKQKIQQLEEQLRQRAASITHTQPSPSRAAAANTTGSTTATQQQQQQQQQPFHRSSIGRGSSSLPLGSAHLPQDSEFATPAAASSSLSRRSLFATAAYPSGASSTAQQSTLGEVPDLLNEMPPVPTGPHEFSRTPVHTHQQQQQQQLPFFQPQRHPFNEQNLQPHQYPLNQQNLQQQRSGIEVKLDRDEVYPPLMLRLVEKKKLLSKPKDRVAPFMLCKCILLIKDENDSAGSPLFRPFCFPRDDPLAAIAHHLKEFKNYVRIKFQIHFHNNFNAKAVLEFKQNFRFQLMKANGELSNVTSDEDIEDWKRDRSEDDRVVTHMKKLRDEATSSVLLLLDDVLNGLKHELVQERTSFDQDKEAIVRSVREAFEKYFNGDEGFWLPIADSLSKGLWQIYMSGRH